MLCTSARARPLFDQLARSFRCAEGRAFALRVEPRTESRPTWVMLLQVLYSVRSERQLMAQVQYILLFRWFIGLSEPPRE